MQQQVRLIRYALSAAIAAALVPSFACAQEAATPQAADAPSSEQDDAVLDAIVVTGSAASGGVKKLEASYNIVSASEEQI